MSEKEIWALQLDWLNIIKILGLDSIEQIPESKRQKAIKRLTRTYGNDLLITLKPEELDELVADELRELMKKELYLNDKKKKEMEREFKEKILPYKRGRIIGINLNDLKDLDPSAGPEEIIKYFSKMIFGDDDDDEKDKDRNKFDEDSTSYYI